MNLTFLLFVMGSHDRVLSGENPCAAMYFEVILPAAVCFTEFGGQMVAAGTHHEASTVVQVKDNGVWTGMMVMRMAGQFHSHGALTGESPLQAQGEIVCVIQTHHSRWPDSCKVLTLAPDSDKDLCTVDLRSPLSTNSSVTFFFFLRKSCCYYLFIPSLSTKDSV